MEFISDSMSEEALSFLLTSLSPLHIDEGEDPHDFFEPHQDDPDSYWLLQNSTRRIKRARSCRDCGSLHAPLDPMSYRVELIDEQFVYGYSCVGNCVANERTL